MASWDTDAQLTHPIDFRLVQNGFVTMFWQPAVLEDTLGRLRSLTYRIIEVYADSWSSEAQMHEDLAAQLEFPDSFGRNLDALNDCMSDVASGDYGWNPKADAGLVIVLRRFDSCAAADRRIAQTLLDIIAGQARSAIFFGNRILCLVQSDDPRLAFEPVGALPVMWNGAEWPNSTRGL